MWWIVSPALWWQSRPSEHNSLTLQLDDWQKDGHLMKKLQWCHKVCISSHLNGLQRCNGWDKCILADSGCSVFIPLTVHVRGLWVVHLTDSGYSVFISLTVHVRGPWVVHLTDSWCGVVSSSLDSTCHTEVCGWCIWPILDAVSSSPWLYMSYGGLWVVHLTDSKCSVFIPLTVMQIYNLPQKYLTLKCSVFIPLTVIQR